MKKEDLTEEVQAYVAAIEEYVDEVDADSAAVKKENADLKAELETLRAAAVEQAVEKASTEDELSEVLKTADPALKAIVLKQQAIIVKAEAHRVEQEMIAKAASVPHISENAETLADVLKTAYGVSAEFGDQIMTVLKAADAQVDAASVWSEFGRPGGDVTVSASVEAKAEEVRKAGNGISREEAIVKAYDDNPDLYDEELKGN